MSESCHPIAGNMVAGKWQLGRKIGSGAFGDVYEGQRLNTSDRVAIKLQHKRHKEEEWRVLKEVIGCEGLPQIYHMGWEKDYHAIVMQMLGDNLETLCEQCKRSFSTDTVAWIAIHCLRMLEALHVKGYVHADVKPDNFLIGTDPTRHQVHIIFEFSHSKVDFGPEIMLSVVHGGPRFGDAVSTCLQWAPCGTDAGVHLLL